MERGSKNYYSIKWVRKLMKKTNRKFLGIVFVLVLALGLSGCACKHKNPSAEWNFDDTHHWRVCTAADCQELLDKAEHTWDEASDTCTVCALTRGAVSFAAGYSPFKLCDGEPVSAPTAQQYAVNGTGEVTVEWYQGETLLDSAPSAPGSYKLVLKMAATETATAAQASMDFVILGTEGANEYLCDDGSVLYTYADTEADVFTTLCQNYAASGYEIYSETNMNGNLFTTFTKGSALAHVYYHPSKNELNLVVSDTAADTLPAKNPAVTDGAYECTVAQIHQDAKNGMSYAVQLKDGSYIVYDGGYKDQAVKLANYMKENYTGEGKPVVRAWVLTHSHGDHTPVFKEFTAKKTEDFIVEHIIVSPLNDEKFTLESSETSYLSTQFYEDAAKFEGAKIVFAHTGMEFTFCNLKMEILMTPESLIKTETSYGDFNDSSVVSRLYGEGYSALFTGDAQKKACGVLMELYGDYLKSDMCQAAHHGLEDAPFEFYDTVKAPILFYPCSRSMYISDRNPEVRQALEKASYTKEILIGDVDTFVRAWGTTFAADAPLYSSLNEIILTTDKTTYKVGEPIMCTATGIGTDWLVVARTDAANWQIRWNLQPAAGRRNVTSGEPFDMTTAPAETRAGARKLTAGEYVIAIIENGAGWANGGRLAEIKITVVE